MRHLLLYLFPFEIFFILAKDCKMDGRLEVFFTKEATNIRVKIKIQNINFPSDVYFDALENGPILLLSALLPHPPQPPSSNRPPPIANPSYLRNLKFLNPGTFKIAKQ